MPSGSLIKKYGLPKRPSFISIGLVVKLLSKTNLAASLMFLTPRPKCLLPIVGKSKAKSVE